jgi:hypothetical protein
MSRRTIFALLAAFGPRVVAGRGTGSSARAQDKAAAGPYAEMLHVGVVVKDLGQAVARWKAMGFADIRVSPPNKEVDRTYHGKPIDVALMQAFVHGTRPMIELVEPLGDGPSPRGDYLKEYGERAPRCLPHPGHRAGTGEVPQAGDGGDRLGQVAGGPDPPGDVPLRAGPERGRRRRVHLAHPPEVGDRNRGDWTGPGSWFVLPCRPTLWGSRPGESVPVRS